jgi:hypothetical protein
LEAIKQKKTDLEARKQEKILTPRKELYSQTGKAASAAPTIKSRGSKRTVLRYLENYSMLRK